MIIAIPYITFAALQTIFWLGYVVLVLTTIGVIIHDNRDPVKALAWILVIALIPFAGITIYVLFGRNHRKDKMFNRKELRDAKQFEKHYRQQMAKVSGVQPMPSSSLEENRKTITLLLKNSKALLTLYNRVEILNNGSETFPEIIAALKQAKKFIHIEYYIFENDTIGGEIAQIMMAKASEGVEVRFIYDDVGSWSLKPRFIRQLKQAGVQVRCFMPVVFPWLTSKVNYRNHRKIVVVDGVVAFTGGINVADRYFAGYKQGLWRDTHLKIEGQAVDMLQMVFITDWYFLSKRLLTEPRYFPKQSVPEQTPVQIASSGPDSDWASIMQAFFSAIARAEKYIYISSPYFLPNQAILTALKVAALGGVEVRVMIPSRSDSKIVYWATRSYIGELLQAGIRVYMYRGGFNHSKLIIIDGVFGSVGTANMDMRSFEHNFEVTALVYNREFAAKMEANFNNDLTHCVEVTQKMWQKRSTLHSIYESISRLMSPLL